MSHATHLTWSTWSIRRWALNDERLIQVLRQNGLFENQPLPSNAQVFSAGSLARILDLLVKSMGEFNFEVQLR